jgi:ribosome maturation protein SDO1
MVSLDEAVTARLKRGSKHFEVLVEPEGALAYKREKNNSSPKHFVCYDN